MTVAVAASTVLLLVASSMFFTRATSRELTRQDGQSFAADGRALETAYVEGSDPADAMDDVLDLVDSMEDRFGIVSARLRDARGKVVSAPRDATLQSVPQGRPVPPQKAGSYEVQTHGGGKELDYLIPLELDGKRYTLDVKQDGHALNQRISGLRDQALVFSLVALLICMMLFYAIGGRRLAQRHDSVLRRATRDPLTDLGNHRSYQEELTRAVAMAERRMEPLAVALVDLDDFKLVNDRHGHRRGDEVLTRVARILEDGRPGDRAFRIGGDEFALLMPDTDSAGATSGLQRRLDTALHGHEPISFSIGTSILQVGSDNDPAMLWEQADAALYQGKRAGGGRVVTFDDMAELVSVVTPAKLHALRSLIEEPRLESAFQPVWDLQHDRLLGLEAVARPWPGYGFDGPEDMFAVAEKLGDAHTLDAICRSAALARAAELPDGALLFLNVHPQSLVHDTLGGDRMVRAVTVAGLEPGQVVLEITERSDASLPQVVADATRLRSLGFQLALDDVGAGNAGLEMLRELTVDFVKIDRTVIAAAVEDPQAQAVIAAILAYASRADAFVIAEGIESEEILRCVRDTNEREIVQQPKIGGGQGFLLGRPSTDLSHVPQSLAGRSVA
jgi:diguanylate cyclase (GGDEF)-like protein